MASLSCRMSRWPAASRTRRRATPFDSSAASRDWARCSSGPSTRPEALACLMASLSMSTSSGSWKRAALKVAVALVRSNASFATSLALCSPVGASEPRPACSSCAAARSRASNRFLALVRSTSAAKSSFSHSEIVAFKSWTSLESNACLSMEILRFRSSIARSLSLASPMSSWSSNSASSACANARCNLTMPPASTAALNSARTPASASRSLSVAFSKTPLPVLSLKSDGTNPAVRACLIPALSPAIIPLSRAAVSASAACCLETSLRNSSSAWASTIGSTSARRASSRHMDKSSASIGSRAIDSRSRWRAKARKALGVVSTVTSTSSSCSFSSVFSSCGIGASALCAARLSRASSIFLATPNSLALFAACSAFM
mmetsp:Transcript_130818/g.326367  ORF Transcript_130818/g.326367 Transcript_130818/m.326367 type:complete len:375 (-) Transcript_130818:1232-2356(-)